MLATSDFGSVKLTFRRLAVDEQYQYILTIKISFVCSASEDVYTLGRG